MPFKLIASKPITSIQAQWAHWQDEKTGLSHFHIHRADSELACLIAVPTRPSDDKGAPHILEHLSLCASRKFPVRNAFFGMRQRSMASFMNAMTDTDITYYPFATPNEKDFFHLMEVYANAVFFPRLDRLDFLQEGWRHTLDASGQLGIDGVVFNEMKGALANADRLYQHHINRALSEGTSRVHLAGGDPVAIPDLTHEELLAFHAAHYHPSRAVVVTYGDIAPERIHEQLAAWVLDEPWPHLEPFPAEPSCLASPVRLEVPIGVQHSPDSEHRMAQAWVLEGGASPVARLEAAVMGHLLFGEGSPLAGVIDDAGFGRQGLLGVDTSGVDIEAQVAMDGLTVAQVEQAEHLIAQALERVGREGVDSAQIQAALRQVEMAQREIAGSGGMPFGVSLALDAAAGFLRGRDPFHAIDRASALEALRERLRTPEDVAAWVRHNLIDNPRRVHIRGIPDLEFFEQRKSRLDERLARSALGLTPAKRQSILADMESLSRRQDDIQSSDSLPLIRPQDVPVAPPLSPEVSWVANTSLPQACVHVPSNGLIQLGISLDMGEVAPEELVWVDTLAWLLPQVGVGHMDWQQAGRWRNEKAGALHASMSIIQPRDSASPALVHVDISAVALERDGACAAEAIARTLHEGRLDEEERISRLLISRVDGLAQQMGVAGDSLARMRAMAHVRPGPALVHLINGPEAFRCWLEQRNRLARGDASDVLGGLRRAMDHFRAAPLVIRAEGEAPALGAAHLAHRLRGHPVSHVDERVSILCPSPEQTALVADTAVNYVWQAFRAPVSGHPDAAAAAVLARMLSHDVLHASIREKGGAYGGGVRYQPGALSFFSYRDPRLSGTLEDFQRAIEYAAAGRLSGKGLDEAVLSVLRDADPPGTPHALAQRAWIRECQGWTYADQAHYREQIRDTSLADVARVAQQWLMDGVSSRVVFTHSRNIEEAERSGLTIEPLFSPPVARMARKNGPG